MSKRCELQNEYYKANGNYKGSGKYSDDYVVWLENEVLSLRAPLKISDAIVHFLNQKATDLKMDVKQITVGIKYAGYLKMDRLYILDKEGNRLCSYDINAPICECKDEWLKQIRLNVMRCKKCGTEY